MTNDREQFWDIVSKVAYFRRPIKATPEAVDLITKACICLHNYLRLTDNAYNVPGGFVDSEDSTGNIIQGDWCAVTDGKSGALQSVSIGRAHNRSSFDANEVWEKFKNSLLVQRDPCLGKKDM